MKSGVELIKYERERQISEEGWSLKHDRSHEDCSLALAAICYATPEKLFIRDDDYVNQTIYKDPWPWEGYDKRLHYGERRNNAGNSIPCPSTYSKKERIDLLIKAGALIAAEIDRLNKQR